MKIKKKKNGWKNLTYFFLIVFFKFDLKMWFANFIAHNQRLAKQILSIKFICGTGCVCCYKFDNVMFDSVQQPERKPRVGVRVVPAQLQSAARTPETFVLLYCVTVKAIVYFCARTCSRLRFVVQWRSLRRFPLFREPRGSAAPEADWCRRRRLYVNSRRMRRKGVWLCSTSCPLRHLLLWGDR